MATFSDWARFEGYADCENCGGRDFDGRGDSPDYADREGPFCEDCGSEAVPTFGPKED
jgi:hypothetical protein